MIKLRSITTFLSAFLLSTLIALSILRVYLHPGVPITHDGENHLARFANYKIALKEGQWPPRFAPNLFHRYGYPVFNYNYPLPSLLSVPFSLIKTPYEMTFKVIMSSAVILTVMGIWTWLSQLKLQRWAKIAAVLSIVVSPYVVQTVLYRGSIGEMLALACLSWWLVWVEKLRSQTDNKNNQTELRRVFFSTETILGGLLVATFFLSHNVTVLFGTPLMIAFSIWWLWQRKEQLLKVLGAFLVGFGLSLWFWLPALVEQSAVVVGGSSLAQQYLQHFPTLHELFISPLQFGFSYVGTVDSLSFEFGAVAWVALFCAVGWLLATVVGRQKSSDKSLNQVFWVMLVLTVLLLVFQLAITSPVWQLIPLARFIQFPWRLALFATLTGAILIAWLIQQNIHWQTALIYLALFIQLIIVLRLVPVGYLQKERVEYELFEQSTTTSNENLPRDFTHQEFADWQPTAIILEGEGSISVQQWNGSHREYYVTSVTPVTVVEPTMYFPGWETVITERNTSKSKEAEYLQDKNTAGRIAYTLPQGTYEVSTHFTQWTWARIIGNIVSLLTGLLILFWSVESFLPRHKKRHTL